MTQSKQTGDLKKDINALMQSIDILRDIYEEENEALSQSDARGFLKLQNKKLSAADVYKERIQCVMARREEVKQRYPDLSHRLNEKQHAFTALTEDNLQGLKRMQRGSERLFDRLRHSAKQSVQAKGVFGYSQNGAVTQSHKAIVSTGISEQV